MCTETERREPHEEAMGPDASLKNHSEWHWSCLTLIRGPYAILLNQVNNHLHDSVPILIREGNLCDKAPDLLVNSAPGDTLGVVPHGRLNIPGGHTMAGLKKPIQNDSKVYDVSHDTADVPVTGQRYQVGLIKDKERTTHVFWYGPFVHWAMRIAVPFKYRSGLFGDLLSTRGLESAWLHSRDSRRGLACS